MSRIFPSMGISHVEDASVTTSTVKAFAIPGRATQVKIEALSGDILVGRGASGTPPVTLDTTNSVVVREDWAEVWQLPVGSEAFSHIYVLGDTGTASIRLSFYG